jgi:serine protease Do
MSRSSSRWVVGVAAVVLLGLLFYGLRTDTRRPPAVAPVATPSVAPAPQASRSTPSPSPVDALSSDLSPKAAAQAAAVPNFVDLVQAVKPAVVSMRVKSDVTPQVTSDDDGANPFEGTPLERFFRRFGPPAQGEQGQAPPRHFYAQGQGSGFFISADGYVVTNNHVVANAVKLEVVMDDGKVLDAKIIGTDPKTDLALVKVEGRGNFPFVSFADDEAKIGEWIIAMGNPFGLGGTVTAGIVSARGRDIGSGPYNDFLQIDAAVNQGNSGGPTFNMSGRVIGVNTAIYSPSGGSVGIAFDIPASIAKPVVAQLKERGYVERGWIGVQVQPLTKEIAESIGMKEAAGALITSIQPDSPAVASGLKPADVVTSINGAKIKDSRDLARQIAALAPNSTVTIEYLRDGKAHTASVRLGQLKEQTARKPPSPAIPGADGQTSKLGMAVAPASRVMGIGEQGLAVLRVDPNGKAAEIGLRPGDIILQVSGKDVSSPQDLAAALQEAATQKKQHLLALIRRSDREVFIAFPVTQS